MHKCIFFYLATMVIITHSYGYVKTFTLNFTNFSVLGFTNGLFDLTFFVFA